MGIRWAIAFLVATWIAFGVAVSDAGADKLGAAVGDVVSRHFDFEGAPIEFANEDRLIGVSLLAGGYVLATLGSLVRAFVDPFSG